MRGGYHEEAMAWRDWLLRAVAGDPPDLQIMYGPAGERRLDEWEVDWLPGYEGSAPVRVGQRRAGPVPARRVRRGHVGAVRGVHGRATRRASRPGTCSVRWWSSSRPSWNEPDDGIWEVRGPRRHFTHSKVMAWVAVDRAVQMVEEFGVRRPGRRWRELRDRDPRRGLRRRGTTTKVGAFTQYYGSDALDASLLMIPLVGFLPATDERVRSTIEAIERGPDRGRLRAALPGTEDTATSTGSTGHEGAFLACSFWMADCLYLIGRHDDAARPVRPAASACATTSGCSPRSTTRVAKRQVGNFPQAFSHVSLVNAAYNLSGHPPWTAADARRARRLAREHGPQHASCARPARRRRSGAQRREAPTTSATGPDASTRRPSR